MSPAKSAFAGLAVGLIAYFSAGHIGSLLPFRGANTMALTDTQVSPSLAPGGTKVPKNGTDSGTKSGAGAKSVAPALAPAGMKLAPTPSAFVTPRVSTTATPAQSVAPSATPRVSVTPNRTATPSPAPTPSPSPSATATPAPSPTVSPSSAPSPVPSASVMPTPTPIVGTSNVVINEIAWAGTATSSSDEWIELYNAGDTRADLSGWALFESETRIIWLTGSMEPGSYYLVERTDDSTVSDIQADAVGPFGGSGLRNLPGGEDLSLRDAGGVAVDSVPCSGGWFAGTAGPDYATMERIDASLPGSDASNWASNTGAITTGLDAAGDPIRGTPKYKNSVSNTSS